MLYLWEISNWKEILALGHQYEHHVQIRVFLQRLGKSQRRIIKN